jgi:hypothetical protein
MGGALAGLAAGRDAQPQRRLPSCVYDDRTGAGLRHDLMRAGNGVFGYNLSQ